jgi:hypothetical protein
MPTISPISVKPSGGKAEKGAVDGAKLLAGQPKTSTRNDYSNGAGKFHCGVWTATKGSWNVNYGEDEFVVLLAGKVKLTPKGGRAKTYKAGDAFVIPKGFVGTWETVEPIRKYYAIAQ